MSNQVTASDLPFLNTFAPQKVSLLKISDDVIACALWFGFPQSKILATLMITRKRFEGKATSAELFLCRKLPLGILINKLYFIRKTLHEELLEKRRCALHFIQFFTRRHEDEEANYRKKLDIFRNK